MRFTLLLIIFNLLVSCSSRTSRSDLEFNLNELYKSKFKQDEPGGSILIKKGDKIKFLKSYGLADIVTKEKISENTIFNTGSISKTFVANGILILKEQGTLSLNDNLDKYFDDFNNKYISQKVTIKHLLSHTSGLPDNRNVRENHDFYLTAKDIENFEPLKQADSLNFESGSRFQYSNPSYNGLALIIEKVTKKPWQEFIKKNIFKPSGMKNSKITNGVYPQSGVAHGYDNYYKKGDSIYFGHYYEYDYGEVPTFAAAGNGGIWCSILDLAKYEKAIQNNIFLDKKTINESRTVFKPENWSDSKKAHIGYSWFIGEDLLFKGKNNFNVDFIHHTGSQGGFRAFYITIPEKDILLVGLFNRPIKKFQKLIFDTVKLLEKNNWIEN